MRLNTDNRLRSEIKNFLNYSAESDFSNKWSVKPGQTKTDLIPTPGCHSGIQVKVCHSRHTTQCDLHNYQNLLSNLLPSFRQEFSLILSKICDSNFEADRVLSDNGFLSNLNLPTIKKQVLSFGLLGANEASISAPSYLIGSCYVNNMRSSILFFRYTDILNYLVSLNFQLSQKKYNLRLGSESLFIIKRHGNTNRKLQMCLHITKLVQHVPCLVYPIVY